MNVVRAATVILGAALFSPAVAQQTDNSDKESLEMTEARAKLKSEHGGQIVSLFFAERFEFLARDGDNELVWEAQGWRGTDEHKLWIKTEGEFSNETTDFEHAEFQALLSRAVRPFWDFQLGFRYDIKPNPSRTYAVVGFQGLAPYWFELDSAIFLSDSGRVSARLEAEYEFRLTQRCILQPRIELNAGFSDDTEIDLGLGLSSAEAGLRLRYEISRQLAPYVGVSWSSTFGETRKLQRADGHSTSDMSAIIGIRFWY
ncbi:MAG: copper resistance protein B [Pseudomonadota bacterium]